MLAQVNNAAGSQSTTRSNSFNIDLEKKSVEIQLLDKDTPDYLSKPPTITDIEEYAPAGCAYAWVIVACASLNMMCTIGIANSFGVFSTYYINFLYPNESAANIAWVGTSITFFMLVGAIATGPLTDRFGFRLVSLADAIICSLAILLTSFTNVLWQVVSTQGIVFGIGTALLYSPSISLSAQWHDKTRPLATAITVAGCGAGGMVFTAITQKLLDTIGYEWALRVLALIILCISGTASLLYKRRVPIPKGGVNFVAIAKDKQLTAAGVAGLCINLGSFVIWYCLPTAALALGQTKQASTNLIIYMNAGSTVGRIVAAFVAMAIGPINLVIFSYLICSTLILVVMLAVKSMVAYIVLAVIFGFISASYISITPPLLTEFFGTQAVATAMGIMNAWCSIGILIGNPSQGAIYQKFDRPTGSFMAITIWGSSSLFLGACCFIVLKTTVISGKLYRIWSKL